MTAHDPGLQQTCDNARRAEMDLKYSGVTPVFYQRARRRADEWWWDIHTRAALTLAPMQRRRLKRTTFIGVTGSCGKTTAKELIHAVLSRRFRGQCHKDSYNLHFRIARFLLQVRPSDDFYLQEVSINYPGYIDASLALLQPQVGVVTMIGMDHRTAFRTPENIADEKGKLISGLPADGLAVLNADDPLVLGMRARTEARCITFGESEAADLRATEVTSTWPDRLTFSVTYQGETKRVETRLCGKLWLPSVLAALATGLGLGVPLHESIQGVAAVEPVTGRMSPVTTPGSVTFVRDDWKCPFPSIAHALQFMQEAQAARKIIVFGSISDFGGATESRYRAVARDTAPLVDAVLFVGPHARHALKAEALVGPGRIYAFEHLREMRVFLKDFLRAGDLVLLKGSNRADHLARIVLDYIESVTCWKDRCSIKQLCDGCPNLRGKG